MVSLLNSRSIASLWIFLGASICAKGAPLTPCHQLDDAYKELNRKHLFQNTLKFKNLDLESKIKHLRMILATLSPGSSDTAAMDQFLEVTSSNANAVLNSSKPTFNGLPISRQILKDNVKGGRGIYNEGVLFYSTTDQTPKRAVKILPTVNPNISFTNPTSLKINFVERRALFRQVRAAYNAELLGGPKVIRHGMIAKKDVDGKTKYFYYLELEEMFAGRKVETYKHIALRDPRRLLTRTSDGKTIFEGMADKFIEAMEHGIVPNDPDFLVAENAGFRWLDSGAWIEARSPEVLVHNQAGVLIQTLTWLNDGKNEALKLDSGALRESQIKAYDELFAQFTTRYLLGLKRTQSLSDENKQEVLRSLGSTSWLSNSVKAALLKSGLSLGANDVQNLRTLYNNIEKTTGPK
jgi:hypothetical protein